MPCKIPGFCIAEKLLISGAHILGASNKEAEKQSEVLDDVTEWQINPQLFKKICEKFVKHNNNLFTLHIIKQLD